MTIPGKQTKKIFFFVVVNQQQKAWMKQFQSLAVLAGTKTSHKMNCIMWATPANLHIYYVQYAFGVEPMGFILSIFQFLYSSII